VDDSWQTAEPSLPLAAKGTDSFGAELGEDPRVKAQLGTKQQPALPPAGMSGTPGLWTCDWSALLPAFKQKENKALLIALLNSVLTHVPGGASVASVLQRTTNKEPHPALMLGSVEWVQLDSEGGMGNKGNNAERLNNAAAVAKAEHKLDPHTYAGIVCMLTELEKAGARVVTSDLPGLTELVKLAAQYCPPTEELVIYQCQAGGGEDSKRALTRHLGRLQTGQEGGERHKERPPKSVHGPPKPATPKKRPAQEAAGPQPPPKQSKEVHRTFSESDAAELAALRAERKREAEECRWANNRWQESAQKKMRAEAALKAAEAAERGARAREREENARSERIKLEMLRDAMDDSAKKQFLMAMLPALQAGSAQAGKAASSEFSFLEKSGKVYPNKGVVRCSNAIFGSCREMVIKR
jgi:hypothetical protein